jgi:tetratricopeptide (TPR) repeat protein
VALTRETVSPTVRLVALALAAGIPLACYVAAASPNAYWHDSGEFVGTATTVGISHPPGHPLDGLVGAACTLIPLGSLALRVAIASALLGALASAFFYLAVERSVRALGVGSNRVAIPLSLGATWLVTGSVAFFFQAVRPEVYALEAALSFIAIERVIHLETSWPTRDVRPIYVAALAVGLALANHHFLAFLLLPAIAPTLARIQRVKGARPLVLAGAVAAVGLSTYVYLPMRAHAKAALALGDPSSLDRLYWVVSAQAFQKSSTLTPEPLLDRFADVLVSTVESLHVLPTLMALGGLYAMLRAPGARRVGFVWLALLLFFGAGRAWLGFIRSNPDALGYLIPFFGAVGALAACFVAAALQTFAAAERGRPRKTAIALALVLAALGLTQIHETIERASLAHFAATDAFEEIGRRSLPTRAVVFAHNPQTIFRFWGGELAEEARPDVSLVPMPLLFYPGMVTSLVARDPELADVLRGRLLDGELREGDLQSLAAERPVLVELDPRVDPALYDTLVADGLFHRALPDRAYDDDRRLGAEAQDAAWARLEALLGEDANELETRNQLLWHYYLSALFYAGTGELERARKAVSKARAINAEANELVALGEALGAKPTEGEEAEPIDVRPFLPSPPE